MSYNHSFKATVMKLIPIAEDTFELSIKVPPSFDFIAGQYITLQLEDVDSAVGREKFRDFSLSSSPNELPTVRIAFRKGRSPYKISIEKLKEGDEVLLDGPKGVFILPKKSSVSMIAGGIGVTPFASMIVTPHNFDGHNGSALHYFNRSVKRAAYLKELQSMSEKIKIQTHSGDFSLQDMPSEELKDSKRTWFIAGPPAMVNVALKELMTSGIPPERIRTEEFSGYV